MHSLLKEKIMWLIVYQSPEVTVNIYSAYIIVTNGMIYTIHVLYSTTNLHKNLDYT